MFSVVHHKLNKKLVCFFNKQSNCYIELFIKEANFKTIKMTLNNNAIEETKVNNNSIIAQQEELYEKDN
jgi:hypothetical protein